MNSTTGRHASACESRYKPVSLGEIRPIACTAVASPITSAVPPTARLPRCTRCHVPGCPSSAEYSHIGETAIRFLNSVPRKCRGVNSFMLLPFARLQLHSTRGPPDTEYGGPDANLRRAFQNGSLKIVGHTHRQNRKSLSEAFLQLALQLSETCKIWPDLVGILEKRRNAH